MSTAGQYSQAAGPQNHPLDFGKIGDGAGCCTDFVQKLQPILTHLFIIDVDCDAVEEGVDMRPQSRHRVHGGFEIFLFGGAASLGLGRVNSLRQRFLFRLLVELCDWSTSIRATVFLFLDADDVGRPLISSEQIFSIPSIEKFRQCFDAAHYKQKIILTLQCEYRVHEIVARALFAELNFEAVGKKRQKIAWQQRLLA